jgi:hypothetical protein
VLNPTNSILYGEVNVDESVFLNTDKNVVIPNMAESYNSIVYLTQKFI